MALASRTEDLFATLGSHLPMGQILFAIVHLIHQCCLSFSREALFAEKSLVCQFQLSFAVYILFAKGLSHLPTESLVCRLLIICQRIVSFTYRKSYLPLHIICQRIVLFTDRKSYLPFQLSHFPNHLQHLPKGGEKISLTPPNGYPEQEKATVGLYSIHSDSLLFFLSRAYTLCKIGHRFALGKGWLIFRRKISFCKISNLWVNEDNFKLKFRVPCMSLLSKYALKSN